MRRIFIGRFLLLLALLSVNFMVTTGSAAAEPAASKQGVADKMLARIDQATWIKDGSSEHVMYIFFDPNCPYCHRVYVDTRDWIKRNAVQIRWIPVGVLTPTSHGKALTLLDAKDPVTLFHKSEENFSGGEGSALDEALEGSDKAEKALKVNAEILRLTGFDAVPSLLFRAKDGQAVIIRGAPPAEKLKEILKYVK